MSLKKTSAEDIRGAFDRACYDFSDDIRRILGISPQTLLHIMESSAFHFEESVPPVPVISDGDSVREGLEMDGGRYGEDENEMDSGVRMKRALLMLTDDSDPGLSELRRKLRERTLRYLGVEREEASPIEGFPAFETEDGVYLVKSPLENHPEAEEEILRTARKKGKKAYCLEPEGEDLLRTFVAGDYLGTISPLAEEMLKKYEPREILDFAEEPGGEKESPEDTGENTEEEREPLTEEFRSADREFPSPEDPDREKKSAEVEEAVRRKVLENGFYNILSEGYVSDFMKARNDDYARLERDAFSLLTEYSTLMTEMEENEKKKRKIAEMMRAELREAIRREYERSLVGNVSSILHNPLHIVFPVFIFSDAAKVSVVSIYETIKKRKEFMEKLGESADSYFAVRAKLENNLSDWRKRFRTFFEDMKKAEREAENFIEDVSSDGFWEKFEKTSDEEKKRWFSNPFIQAYIKDGKEGVVALKDKLDEILGSGTIVLPDGSTVPALGNEKGSPSERKRAKRVMKKFKDIVYEEMHFTDIYSGVIDKDAAEKEFLKRMPVAMAFENVLEIEGNENTRRLAKSFGVDLGEMEMQSDWRGRALKHIAFSKDDLETIKTAVDLENVAKMAFHNPYANLSRALDAWKPILENENVLETYKNKTEFEKSVITLLMSATNPKNLNAESIEEYMEKTKEALEDDAFVKLAILSSDPGVPEKMKEFVARTGGNAENPLADLAFERGSVAREDAVEYILASMDEKTRRDLLGRFSDKEYIEKMKTALKKNFERNAKEILANVKAAANVDDGDRALVSTLRGIRKELLYAYTAADLFWNVKRGTEELMKEYGVTLDDIGKEGVIEEKIRKYAEEKKKEFSKNTPKEYVERAMEKAKNIGMVPEGMFGRVKTRVAKSFAESVYFSMDFNSAFKRIKEELSTKAGRKPYRISAQILFDKEFPAEKEGELGRLYAEALMDASKMKELNKAVVEKLSEKYSTLKNARADIYREGGDMVFRFTFPKDTVRAEIPSFFGESAYLSSDFSFDAKRFFRNLGVEDFRRYNTIDFLREEDFREKLAFFAENRIPRLERAFRMKKEISENTYASRIMRSIYETLSKKGVVPRMSLMDSKNAERMRRRLLKHTPIYEKREDGSIAISRKQFERFAKETGVSESEAKKEKGVIILEGKAAERWKEYERSFLEKAGIGINEIERMRNNLHAPLIDYGVDRSLSPEELRKRNEIRQSLESVREEYERIRKAIVEEAEKKAREEEEKKKEEERKREDNDFTGKPGVGI